MNGSPRILISAGEASGDRLGAGLARSLRRLRPSVELVGMGGEEMAEEGVRRVQDAAEVAVVGFVEVLSHLGAIRGAMARLEETLDRWRPDVLVPVDFPDFNLRLAARAARRGIPVVYFVSPQVWAWRRRRVHRIRRLVRRMLVLFPFEERFYREAGVPVTFVGHPAVERICAAGPDPAILAKAGLEPGRPVVALLPGSRRGEVERLLPPMLGAARRLRETRPGVQFLLPRARTLPEASLRGPLERSGVEGVRIHDGDYPAILGSCSAGVVASGTATLEAALVGLPMVVVYRMRALSYVLGRMLVRVPHVALANLVAGREIVPELIQSHCTPERIAAEVERYLGSPGRVREVREGLAEVRQRLGEPGAFDRAAKAVLDEVNSALS